MIFSNRNVLSLLLLIPYAISFTTTTTKHARSLDTFVRMASSTDIDTSSKKTNTHEVEGTNSNSLGDSIKNSGLVSAAAVATAAVNAAVSMKTLEAPDVQKSYISMNRDNVGAEGTVDEDGLPLVYDKDLIEKYWSKEKGALNQRWGTFVGKAVPFLTKLTTLFIRDGKITDAEIPALSKQARLDLQALGPTFIKAGQMMSVRPDVLPQATLDELSVLQDAVEPFDTKIAVEQIERELGGPLGEFFTSISEEPVAAASLAQVYLATLADGKDTRVAVKVQRPDVLGTVSKDLFVLRRAAEVFQGLIERFAPQQKTNYVGLLNEWSIGFYTELDFQNEAANQRSISKMFKDSNVTDVIVPKVYDDLCTRRIMVSEWIDGRSLSEASPEELAEVTPAAQEAFLTQLFGTLGGRMHADPHMGNWKILDEPRDGAKLALLDFGLVADVDPTDRDYMISAVIHLANKDYASLVDDFIKLKILPADSNRAAIIPLMDKALSPYVKGGGAKKYEAELRKLYGMEDDMQSQVGGFQAMTQDALTVLNDVPFSIPPYFAILGRAIVTLEGVALTGNPDYGLIMESYPFIARKLMSEGRPEIQKALQEVLYSDEDGNKSAGLKLTRLLALLNNAAGVVATQDGAAFVDLDAVPENGLALQDGLRYLLSDKAESLRALLEPEVDNVVDVISRQVFRRGVAEALSTLTPPRPPSLPFIGNVFPEPPAFENVPLPIPLPPITNGGTSNNRPSVALLNLKEFTQTVAPKLSQEEELYALGIADGAKEFFGPEIGDLVSGENVLSPDTINLVLQAIRSGALGRSDILSSDVAQSVVGFVETAVNTVRPNGSSTTGTEADLLAAINDLSAEERTRLDDIATEITNRAMSRVVDRLAKVERLL